MAQHAEHLSRIVEHDGEEHRGESGAVAADLEQELLFGLTMGVTYERGGLECDRRSRGGDRDEDLEVLTAQGRGTGPERQAESADG